jgi:hypothetical protein
MDTDSIAIVSTEQGRLVPCPGGPERTHDGSEAVKALSWEEVEQVRNALAGLNPYDQELVPGSILDLEEENFSDDPSTRGGRTQLWCYSIIAKRYALFNIEDGLIRIRKGSEHTLGSYRPPINPNTGLAVEDWSDRCWEIILQREIGGPVADPPVWFRQVAVRTLRASRPMMMSWIGGGQLRPYDLLEHAAPGRLSHVPKSPNGMAVCLVRVSSAGKGPSDWVDLHDPDGPTYRVVAGQRETFNPRVVRGETYGDLVDQHPLRPEPKSSDAEGEPCSSHTKGLLGHRHVFVKELRVIGKEANEFELFEAGIVEDEDEYLTEYQRDIRDFLPEILRLIPAKSIQQGLKCSRRYSFSLRRGERRPSRRLLPQVISLAAQFARDYLVERKEPNIPAEDELAIMRFGQSLNENRFR